MRGWLANVVFGRGCSRDDFVLDCSRLRIGESGFFEMMFIDSVDEPDSANEIRNVVTAANSSPFS